MYQVMLDVDESLKQDGEHAKVVGARAAHPGADSDDEEEEKDDKDAVDTVIPQPEELASEENKKEPAADETVEEGELVSNEPSVDGEGEPDVKKAKMS